MTKLASKVLVAAGFVPAAVLASVLGSILFFVATRAADFAAQDRRLAAFASSPPPEAGGGDLVWDNAI